MSEAKTVFEIARQSAQNISNVGGNQTINYGDRSRAARIGKVLAALGLVLFLVGLALLVRVGVMTTLDVLDAVSTPAGVQTPYTDYLASSWPAAVGLLMGGLVVNRFAQILVGR